MKKKRKSFQIALSSTFAAFCVALDYLCSLKTDTSRYTIYALPLLLAGMTFGPTIGALTGLAAGFISQALSYGIMPTTILWVLAPTAWGFISGLIAKGFKFKFSVFKVSINVAITSFIVLIINSLALIIDGYIANKPTAFVYANLFTRMITASIVGVFYTLMIILIMPKIDPRLKKSTTTDELNVIVQKDLNSAEITIKIKK